MENFDILDLTMTMNESKPASGHSCTPVGRLGEESLYSPEDQGRDICNHNHNDCNDDDDDLYIMGAVCLCVCYVFSYSNYFGR